MHSSVQGAQVTTSSSFGKRTSLFPGFVRNYTRHTWLAIISGIAFLAIAFSRNNSCAGMELSGCVPIRVILFATRPQCVVGRDALNGDELRVASDSVLGRFGDMDRADRTRVLQEEDLKCIPLEAGDVFVLREVIRGLPRTGWLGSSSELMARESRLLALAYFSAMTPLALGMVILLALSCIVLYATLITGDDVGASQTSKPVFLSVLTLSSGLAAVVLAVQSTSSVYPVRTDAVLDLSVIALVCSVVMQRFMITSVLLDAPPWPFWVGMALFYVMVVVLSVLFSVMQDSEEIFVAGMVALLVYLLVSGPFWYYIVAWSQRTLPSTPLGRALDQVYRTRRDTLAEEVESVTGPTQPTGHNNSDNTLIHPSGGGAIESTTVDTTIPPRQLSRIVSVASESSGPTTPSILRIPSVNCLCWRLRPSKAAGPLAISTLLVSLVILTITPLLQATGMLPLHVTYPVIAVIVALHLFLIEVPRVVLIGQLDVAHSTQGLLVAAHARDEARLRQHRDLAAFLFHEIKQPISSIVLGLNELEEELNLPAHPTSVRAFAASDHSPPLEPEEPPSSRQPPALSLTENGAEGIETKEDDDEEKHFLAESTHKKEQDDFLAGSTHKREQDDFLAGSTHKRDDFLAGSTLKKDDFVTATTQKAEQDDFLATTTYQQDSFSAPAKHGQLPPNTISSPVLQAFSQSTSPRSRATTTAQNQPGSVLANGEVPTSTSASNLLVRVTSPKSSLAGTSGVDGLRKRRSLRIQEPSNTSELLSPRRRTATVSVSSMQIMVDLRSAAAAVHAVLTDALAFTKIAAGEFALTMAPHDPRDLLASAVSSLAPAARERNIRVICAVNPNVPTAVQLDVARMGQVVRNLLSNAIKFSPEGSPVLIRCGLASSVRSAMRGDESLRLVPTAETYFETPIENSEPAILDPFKILCHPCRDALCCPACISRRRQSSTASNTDTSPPLPLHPQPPQTNTQINTNPSNQTHTTSSSRKSNQSSGPVLLSLQNIRASSGFPRSGDLVGPAASGSPHRNESIEEEEEEDEDGDRPASADIRNVVGSNQNTNNTVFGSLNRSFGGHSSGTSPDKLSPDNRTHDHGESRAVVLGPTITETEEEPEDSEASVVRTNSKSEAVTVARRPPVGLRASARVGPASMSHSKLRVETPAIGGGAGAGIPPARKTAVSFPTDAPLPGTGKAHTTTLEVHAAPASTDRAAGLGRRTRGRTDRAHGRSRYGHRHSHNHHHRPRALVIEVVDHGAGIPAKDKARIFRPYFQTDDGKRQGTKGTGLGLSISQAIVEQHRGRVGFASRPGFTCFTVAVPLRHSSSSDTAGFSSDTHSPSHSHLRHVGSGNSHTGWWDQSLGGSLGPGSPLPPGGVGHGSTTTSITGTGTTRTPLHGSEAAAQLGRWADNGGKLPMSLLEQAASTGPENEPMRTDDMLAEVSVFDPRLRQSSGGGGGGIPPQNISSGGGATPLARSAMHRASSRNPPPPNTTTQKPQPNSTSPPNANPTSASLSSSLSPRHQNNAPMLARISEGSEHGHSQTHKLRTPVHAQITDAKPTDSTHLTVTTAAPGSTVEPPKDHATTTTAPSNDDSPHSSTQFPGAQSLRDQPNLERSVSGEVSPSTSPTVVRAPRSRRQRSTNESVGEERERPVRILVAEDDRINRRMMTRTILRANADWGVVAVGSGEDALSQVMAAAENGKPFHCVLADFHMPPGMDGDELVRRLKQHPEDSVRAIRALGVTGSEDPEELQRFREAGTLGIVTKPTTRDALVRAITLALQNE